MGYLNESFGRVERVMSIMQMCDEQQDWLRTGFYLGAKIFFEAACKSSEMDDAPGRALLDGCRADIDAYDARIMQKALSILEKTQ
ncbi:hypothetical protein [Paraburkholderia adhaesiva]|uniref:hypothetical protein n=1 Tax=Paraburkholderia adhaesiva TaxID=2883244 RepID=UPI001F380F56|nr:hypothetical protein [Paraburkholderia adhaesiva]